MRILTHTVAAGEDGLTVRQLLRSLWHIDHSLLSRLKFRNAITLNGAPVTVRAVAHTGDLLCADVSDPPGENPHIQPVDFPLDVLYEDDDLLLLNKLLEAMSMRLPCITTSLANDSLHAADGKEILVGNDSSELAADIITTTTRYTRAHGKQHGRHEQKTENLFHN